MCTSNLLLICSNTMKSLYLYILLFCANAIYATITGSYNYGHPLFIKSKLNTQGESELHKIQKRQENSDENDVCTRALADELCNNGFYQGYASILQSCNDSSQEAQTLQNDCTQNSMGEYCGLLGDILKTSGIETVCNNSIDTCSPECRSLLNTTRQRLGCCINFINSTLYSDYSSSLPAILPWSSCGVEPVTQQCEPGPIDLQSGVHLPCSSEAFISNVLCRQQYIQDIQNRLANTEGCESYVYLDSNTCRVNHLGIYCQLQDNLLLDSLYTTARERCDNTSTCDPLCIEVLNNITITVGCCFNDQYNTTWTQDWLSYEFWSRCGLEALGICEDRFFNDNLHATTAGSDTSISTNSQHSDLSATTDTSTSTDSSTRLSTTASDAGSSSSTTSDTPISTNSQHNGLSATTDTNTSADSSTRLSTTASDAGSSSSTTNESPNDALVLKASRIICSMVITLIIILTLDASC